MLVMDTCLYERFQDTIEDIPAKGVLRVVKLQCHMLQNDLARKHTLPLNDVRSIFAFYNFLKCAADGIRIPPVILPMQHISFYRKTVERLIAAEQLPFAAKDQFEEVFHSGFAKAHTS
jgi:hypothetical protein